MALDMDQSRCIEQFKKQHVLLGIGQHIVKMDHSQFGRTDTNEGRPLRIHISKMAFNSLTGDIFIADNTESAIYLVNNTNSKKKLLVSKDIANVSSMAFGKLTTS